MFKLKQQCQFLISDCQSWVSIPCMHTVLPENPSQVHEWHISQWQRNVGREGREREGDYLYFALALCNSQIVPTDTSRIKDRLNIILVLWRKKIVWSEMKETSVKAWVYVTGPRIGCHGNNKEICNVQKMVRNNEDTTAQFVIQVASLFKFTNKIQTFLWVSLFQSSTVHQIFTTSYILF